MGRSDADDPHHSAPSIVVAPGPLSFVARGNSDPFDAYPVDIDPHINRMIAFARESYYPSLSVSPWQRKQPRSPEDALRFFNLGRTSADSTVAHLTSYGAALTRIMPADSKRSFEKAWLQVRSKALQTLRRSLSHNHKSSAPAVSLIQQCLYLFQGDVEARFFQTARIHATTLRYLFQPQPPTPTTIFLFLTAMHSTLETATYPLQPPIMTFDDWYPEMWHSIWSNAETMLSSFAPQPDESLHPGLTSPYIREVLLRLRLYFSVPGLHLSTDTPEKKTQNDLVLLWAATRLVDDAAKLLSYFLDQMRLCRTSSLAATPDAQGAVTDVSIEDVQWKTMLTLTTFCCIRHHAHSPLLDDTDIDLRDASYILAPKFKEVLTYLEDHISDAEREKNSEVLLWVYFTGAIFEQRKSLYRWQMLEEAKGEREIWWFTRKLADQARLLKLRKWSDARSALERFAYGDDILEPNPREWWDGIFDV